jgi:heptosyltransferase-2
MGDLVISTAIMEDIRSAFPGAELHLNTLSPWDRLLFADDDRFASIFTVDLRGKEKGVRGIWKWFRMVNAGRYDAIFDLQSNDRTRMLLTLLRLFGRHVPYLVGNHDRFPYTVAPGPHPPFTHAFDMQRRTLAACGIASTTVRPSLRIPLRNRERAARLQDDNGLCPGGYVVFLPGSQAGGRLKRWGTERFIRLGELLRQEGISPVVLIGGKDEEEECRGIREALGSDGAVNLCGQTEVLDIIPLCADARFIVANDTGTAHLASSTGRPMVVVCGPTDPRRVKPLGENVVTLQADLECINCYRKECDTHACMAMITPEMVRERLADLYSLTRREGDGHGH